MVNSKKTSTILLAIIGIAAITSTIFLVPTISAQKATQLPANIGNMTNPTEPPKQNQNQNQTGNNNTQTPTTIPHLPVQNIQDDRYIVTIVTKNGPPPEGPIIAVPPEPGKPGNGTVVIPGQNTTGQNENITIIQPGGNITEVPNGNLTEIDNGSGVIITPPEQNITTTPGNVTVIDPLPINNTGAGAGAGNENATTPTQPCTCNQSQGSAGQIPPVVVTPAPGQNVTTSNPILGQPVNTTGSNNTTVTPPPPMPPVNTNASNSNQTGGNNNNNNQTNHPQQLPVAFSFPRL